MVGKKFCAAFCASSIAFSAVSAEASWKAYNITSGIFQMVKDVTKITAGIGITAICAGALPRVTNEDVKNILILPGSLGLVTALDGLVSLLSDIGEIGNGITAGRAVKSKKGLKELTKRTEALEKNANITGSKAIEK